MSQLASFNLIESSKLPDLLNHADITVTKSFFRKKIVDNYWTYLENNSTNLYGHSSEHLNGGIFLNIILYLKYEKNLALESGTYSHLSTEITQKRQTSTFILTKDHKEKFNSAVNVESMSIQKLQSINTEYEGDDSEASANDLKEALFAMSNVLSKLEDENHVIIFSIC